MMTQQTDYKKIAQLSKEAFVEAFNLSSAGLNDETVQTRQQEQGLNIISSERKIDTVKEWMQILITPLTILLFALAIIYFIFYYLLATSAEKDLSGVVIILLLISLKVGLLYFQTKQSRELIQKAKSEIDKDVPVLRDGNFQELASEELVYGDTIKIETGQYVPADIRLISAQNFSVSQMILTGDSENFIKRTVQNADNSENEEVTTLETLTFAGSVVESGNAEGVVIATGPSTLLAQRMKELNQFENVYSFDEKMNDLSKWILQIALIVSPLVVLIYGMITGMWYQGLIFGLSVVVVASPEFFPLIISSSFIHQIKQLDISGIRVKKRGVMSKLNSLNTIVIDGTESLSKEKLELISVLNPQGEQSDHVLTYAYLHAISDSISNKRMNQQIVERAEETLNTEDMLCEIINSRPLGHNQVVEINTHSHRQLIIQGEAKALARQCSLIENNGENKELSKEWLTRFEDYVDELNYDGLRVIGLASKPTSSSSENPDLTSDNDMVFLGYLVFSIPIHENVAHFTNLVQELDMELKLITDDSRTFVSSKLRELGFDSVKIITGDKLAMLNDEQLKDIAMRYRVFAQIDDEQKDRIVQALQQNGDIVAYLAEGANDGTSLLLSDVGITTMNATDTAKKFADITIEEQDLLQVEELIVSGRKATANIMKYILTIGSYYLGIVLAILAASFFLPFVPMEPQQLLILNTIISLSFAALLWDNVSDDAIIKSAEYSNYSIKQSMIRFGTIRFVCDVFFFILLYWFVLPGTMGGSYQSLAVQDQLIFQQLFRSNWFIMSLWTQTYALYILKASKLNPISNTPPIQMMYIPILGLVIGTLLPYSPIGGTIEFVALSFDYWKWILIFLIGYLVVVLCVKYFTLRNKETDLE